MLAAASNSATTSVGPIAAALKVLGGVDLASTMSAYLAGKLDLADPSTRVFLPSFLVLCALYPLLVPCFALRDPQKRQKQAAWILTTLAAGLMTLASLPFLADYVRAGGAVGAVRDRAWAGGVNRFFQAYLAADLLVGLLCYRAQVGVLTGWVHHALYLGITEVAIRNGWAGIFCMCAIMELPTFLLGLATLLPRTRSNALFAATFLATRIMLHLVLVCAYAVAPVAPLVPSTSSLYAPSSASPYPHTSLAQAWGAEAYATGGGAAASMGVFGAVVRGAMAAMGGVRGTRCVSALLALVFPLHAMWFAGCVRGFVRRARAAAALKSTSTLHSDAKHGTAGATHETPTASTGQSQRHALAPDIYPDARSLARHARPVLGAAPAPFSAFAPFTPFSPFTPWTALQVTRLRRLRAFVQNRPKVIRPLRPRAMARRVSEGLISVLGEGVGFVVGR